MEKESDSQLELFSHSGDSPAFKANVANPIFERLWRYEKAILIILLILVTGIIAFSLGVEKGKRAALAVTLPTLPQANVKKEAVVKPVTAGLKQGFFTIQVATFKTRDNAVREAEFIKRKGLSAILLSKGGYYILCAGNFPDKESAQPWLAQMNKRYLNCSLRRL